MQDETVDVEEEAAMKKVDVLTKKNEMISGTIQHARASAWELKVEKWKAEVCLKSSVLEV